MKSFGSTSRRAMVSVLARRSASACALPRPSATASARLAKTTVSHSHMVISQSKTPPSLIARTVVNSAPISTMNITGLLPKRSRVELLERSRQRFPQLLRVEESAAYLARPAGGGGRPRMASPLLVPRWCSSVQAFRERSQRERREVGEGDDDHRRAEEEENEERPIGRQSAGRRWDRLAGGPATRQVPGRR